MYVVVVLNCNYLLRINMCAITRVKNRVTHFEGKKCREHSGDSLLQILTKGFSTWIHRILWHSSGANTSASSSMMNSPGRMEKIKKRKTANSEMFRDVETFAI